MLDRMRLVIIKVVDLYQTLERKNLGMKLDSIININCSTTTTLGKGHMMMTGPMSHLKRNQLNVYSVSRIILMMSVLCTKP